MDKLKRDFKISELYVEENYKKVKQIIAELSVFQMPNWSEGNVKFT